MRRLGFAVWLLAAGAAAQEPQGDRARAAELFAREDFAAAAEELAAALDRAPEDARLAYNLALARWRAGDADGAETAAEKAAALSGGELSPLRDGIVGNLRYGAARSAMAQDLEAALELARQAKTHYTRGALEPGAPAALARNLERALRLIEEIEKQIEEQKQQQDQQQQDQQQQDPQQEGEPQPDPQQDQQQPPPDESEEPEPQPGEQEEQPPEPQPGEQEQEQQPEQQSEQQTEPPPEQQPEQQPAEPQQATPLQLSEEEKKRLLQKLEQLEALRAARRAEQQRRRPTVERDW